jgi:hypothetical protein
MWWKILLIIIAVIVFGTVALTVVAYALETLAMGLRWVAKIIDWFGFRGII